MKIFVAYCETPTISGRPMTHVHGAMTGTASFPHTGWSHDAVPVEVDSWAEAQALICHRFEDNICRLCAVDRRDAWGHHLPCSEPADLVQGDAKLRENSGDADATENHNEQEQR